MEEAKNTGAVSDLPEGQLNIQALVQQKLESLKQQLPSHLAELANVRALLKSMQSEQTEE